MSIEGLFACSQVIIRHVQFVSNRVSRPRSGVLILVLSAQPSL